MIGGIFNALPKWNRLCKYAAQTQHKKIHQVKSRDHNGGVVGPELACGMCKLESLWLHRPVHWAIVAALRSNPRPWWIYLVIPLRNWSAQFGGDRTTGLGGKQIAVISWQLFASPSDFGFIYSILVILTVFCLISMLRMIVWWLNTKFTRWKSILHGQSSWVLFFFLTN